MGGRRRTAKEKLRVLRAADRLGVSEACRQAGVSRDVFYRWRRALKTGGAAALEPTSRRRPLLARRMDPALEAAVLAHTQTWPTMHQKRVAHDVGVSPTGVRCVWLRNGVGTTAEARIAWASAQPEVVQEYQCPACHRWFDAAGPPPHVCAHCGVGGVGGLMPAYRPMRKQRP